MKKPRSDNKLLNMPEEHQAKLADWLLSGMPYHQAKELVLKEFAVSVSLASFTGFWSAVCSEELLRRRCRAVNIAGDVAQAAANTPGRFDSATIDALKQKAFELAISPQADPAQVKSIFALVLKARDQDLDERKLVQAERKIVLLEDKAAQAKAAITNALTKSKGGLTPETLKQIEEAAALL